MILWSSKDSEEEEVVLKIVVIFFLCDVAKKIRYDVDHACKKKYCYHNDSNCKLTIVRLANRSDRQEKKEKVSGKEAINYMREKESMDAWSDGRVDTPTNMGVVEYARGTCAWTGGKGDCNISKICYMSTLYICSSLALTGQLLL